MSSLVEEVKGLYNLSLSPDYVERCQQAKPQLRAEELYRKALQENLRDVCGPTLLPYGVAAQTSATLPRAVVMQINTSRDATQPLRPCADVTEEEAILNAAAQRNSSKRLLRLSLSDGSVEIPAVELSTLQVFKGIPIPGEKVLIGKDAEVRNGCILLTEANVKLLGGEVSQLKQDFLAHRRRLEGGYQTSKGLDDAPRFAPLELGQHYQRPMTGQAAPQSSNFNNGYNRGGGRGGGHGGDRGRGRGQQGGRGRGSGDHGRGRGYQGSRGSGGSGSDGGRGYGYRGRGGSDRGRGGYQGRGGAGGGYHVDTSNFHPPMERFPEINEANFPRLA